MKLFELYANLINNPLADKPYRDIAKYYEACNRMAEANVFLTVSQCRDNNTNTDEEQRKDN
jgi:hypothetical protein